MRRQRANSVACSKKELKKLAYFHELVKKEVEAGLINDESLNYIQTIQNVSTSSFSPPTKVLKPVSKIKLTTLKTPVSIKTIAKNFKHSVGSVSNETGVSTSPTDKLILVARKIQIETQTANGTSFLEATPTSIFRRQSPVQTSTANSQKSTAMKVKAAKNPTKSVQKQAQLASTSMNQSLKSDVDSPSASISTKIINDEPKSSFFHTIATNIAEVENKRLEIECQRLEIEKHRLEIEKQRFKREKQMGTEMMALFKAVAYGNVDK